LGSGKKLLTKLREDAGPYIIGAQSEAKEKSEPGKAADYGLHEVDCL